MAGIYVHIPFCKKACHYCNFHFSTSFSTKKEVVETMLHEIESQKTFFNQKKITTLYFGGGTPSVLDIEEVKKIVDGLDATFGLQHIQEFTFEFNPEDMSKDYLKALKEIGVNRLSIGVQSFFDEELQWMNRNHTAQKSLECIKLAQKIGFENISIDLIYGLPSEVDRWSENLEIVKGLDIPHLSTYALTVEEKTPLDNWVRKGKIKAPEEELAAQHFEQLQRFAQENKYEAYEVSNLAKKESYSMHNTNYWRGETYLGIGPAAHSFDGVKRFWNVSNNAKYIQNFAENREEEILTETDTYNEYVMTALRTIWGIDETRILKFSEEIQSYFFQEIVLLVQQKKLVRTTKGWVIPTNYRFMSDGIAADVFKTD